jgi:hypothetical protein
VGGRGCARDGLDDRAIEQTIPLVCEIDHLLLLVRAAQRNFGCRITLCRIEGMRAVILENASLRVGVLADKGADVYELLYKPEDVDVLWRSPNGIVNPRLGDPSVASGDGAFMDAYEGGWQEMFPTLGAPADYYGGELGQHGEVAMLPWDVTIERDAPDEIAVTFEVRCRRSPFRLRRTMSLTGTATLQINETVVNEGAEELEFMWGHHPVLGSPFLAPGCILSLPGGRVQPMERVDGVYRPQGTSAKWPTYVSANGQCEDLRLLPDPGSGHVDELCVADLPDGWYAVTNPSVGVGFALRWDATVFPYLWMWRTLGPEGGYPWFGRTYTLGLEPFSSIPPHFPDARREGTTLRLGVGETMSVSLEATLFRGTGPVRSVGAHGNVVMDAWLS